MNELCEHGVPWVGPGPPCARCGGVGPYQARVYDFRIEDNVYDPKLAPGPRRLVPDPRPGRVVEGSWNLRADDPYNLSDGEIVWKLRQDFALAAGQSARFGAIVVVT